MSGTDIPEENAEGVDVHTVVVVASEELWSHVDRGAYDAAAHHGLRLAETQVCDSSTVLPVKLGEKR